MHLSKPYFDGETLLVNVVNPTAGLFSGDSVESSVEVEGLARVLLTSPSACRVHRATKDFASVVQSFTVRSGGFLEVFPELFIPQAGARYRQSTTVDVEEGGRIILLEAIAPGRVASGEVFEFEQLEWETHVRLQRRSVIRERFQLTPSTAALAAARRQIPDFYLANAFAVGLELSGEIVSAISNLHGRREWIGASRLVKDGWSIRIVAQDACELRRIIAEVRRLLYSAMNCMPPSLRRF